MAFEKNWRDRRIVHKTPGGKLTRVKISSLTAKEQQKYNPNRYKRGADTQMGPDDWAELQKREVDKGHIFDFYVQVDDPKDLDNIQEEDLTLATTSGLTVGKLFDSDKLIIKLKNVPLKAVSKVLEDRDKDDEIDFTEIDKSEIPNLDFEDVTELEDDERYEKVKFNDEQIFKLDIAPYMDNIEVVIDDPDYEADEVSEGFSFSEYYFKN